MIDLQPLEPIDGGRVRIRIEVDGVALVDADLTTLHYRAKFGGDDVVMPFWYAPFVPPADDNEAAPAEPVMAALRLTPVEYQRAFLPAEPWDLIRSMVLT